MHISAFPEFPTLLLLMMILIVLASLNIKHVLGVPSLFLVADRRCNGSVLKQSKVYAVRRHGGSLCTQKQTETAALQAAIRKRDPVGELH